MAVALEPSFLTTRICRLVDGARVHAADTDAADEVGVVDGHALHGQRGVLVNLGRGHVVDNHIEQRVHVHVAVVGVKTGKAVHGAGVDHVLHANSSWSSVAPGRP